MPSPQTLNLIGIGWPVCLLECKNELNELNAGQKLEIKVRDPNVLKELLTIIERGGDFRVSHQREGNHYRIRIRKQ
jgi:TusA-related sulfurtransferase